MSSRRSRIALVFLCVMLAVSALACIGGDGDLVQDMQDTNQALQDTSNSMHDAGLLK